ncbi:hypothetical protein IRJ41_019631 [Triplophysa rosa]|uniref:Uncharacterized protein n=1 Tax=Triplophysa rosa TaxID=992332 RepID=A0A9W7WE06_TRIRA|nr:hypothetical protein IRJ41_019631 [Triplophysa rosa]
MNNHGHSHVMPFCPLRCFRDLTGFMRNAGSMAWNPTLKQRLQLQITNQRGVPSLDTFTENGRGSSSPNTGVYSNTTLQGRSLKDSRHLSEKTSRKSFIGRKALLIACGVRCVLSPRPTNCSASSAYKDEKDRPRSSPARGERVEKQMDGWAVYSGIKRTEERQRARNSIKRERVTKDLTQRPSTVPLENQTGRRAHSTPEIPTCKILWRRKDDQSFLQNGPQHTAEDQRPDLTPFLHLYLPSYQPKKKREEPMEKQENSLEIHNKQAVTEEVREHDVITESQNQDITVNKINEERQHDFTDGIQYDITNTSRHDISVGKTQEENFENDITEGKKSQSITDNEVTQQNQCDITDVGESNNVPEDKEQNDTQEKKNIHSRTLHTRRVSKTSDGKLMGKTRYPAPATALTFPYSLMDRNPSPTVSVLPSFYGTPFGCRIRKFNTPEHGSSKTRTRKVYNDIRFIKPTNDMRHAIETKGNRCLLQTKADAVISPRPKIMSTERGVPPHKMKTTKTFLWGPEGPQETKTVCELQSPVNRWRSSD